MSKSKSEATTARDTEESVLSLDELSIGMPITVIFADTQTTANYTVADISNRNTVGELGRTADVILEDIQGKEHRFSAADLGLDTHLGGFWSKNRTTRR
jgi:hypothetical protein